MYAFDNWTNPAKPEDKPLLPPDAVVLLSAEAQYSMYYGAVGTHNGAEFNCMKRLAGRLSTHCSGILLPSATAIVLPFSSTMPTAP